MEVEVISFSGESSEWQCSLLKIGSMHILLDCGWCGKERVAAFQDAIMPYLPKIDLILISHSDIYHCGGLAMLYLQNKMHCPILATEPVRYLGELSLLSSVEGVEKYTSCSIDADNVVEVFHRITELKYTQTYRLEKSASLALVITPFPCGGRLGGSFWRINMGSQKIVYCVDFDCKSTRYLHGIAINKIIRSGERGDLARPSILITSLPAVRGDVPRLGWDRHLGQTQHSIVQSSDKRGTESGYMKLSQVAITCGEEFFLEKTVATLRAGGDVLVPLDNVDVLMPLMCLLDEAWAVSQTLSDRCEIFWVCSYGDMIQEQFKTRLEWMNQRAHREFEEKQHKTNPFELQNVKFFPTIEEMFAKGATASKRRVIFSGPTTLEIGDSRELFMRMAGNPRNLVWLFNQPVENCLTSDLIDDFIVKKRTQKEYFLAQHVRIPLSEAELRAYYEEKRKEEKDQKENYESEEEAEEEAANPMTGKKEPFIQLPWWRVKTFSSDDSKVAADEYGVPITEADFKPWRQFNAYFHDTTTKQAAAKKEEEDVEEDDGFDWMRDMRIRYGEPKTHEERDRVIDVVCSFQFCPVGSLDTRDVRTFISAAEAKHVVLLPTVREEFSRQSLVEQFSSSLMRQTVGMQLYPLGNSFSSFPSAKIRLCGGMKRRAQISASLWDRVKFQKVSAFGSKVAFVSCNVDEDGFLVEDELSALPRDSFFLNAPKLSNFRHELVSQGSFENTNLEFRSLPNDWRGGIEIDHIHDSDKMQIGLSRMLRREPQSAPVNKALEIDKCVKIVSKPTDNHSAVTGMHLEGAVCPQFYKARRALYRRCFVG